MQERYELQGPFRKKGDHRGTRNLLESYDSLNNSFIINKKTEHKWRLKNNCIQMDRTSHPAGSLCFGWAHVCEI